MIAALGIGMQVLPSGPLILPSEERTIYAMRQEKNGKGRPVRKATAEVVEGRELPIHPIADMIPPMSASSHWESSFVNVSASGKLHERAVTITLHASYAQRFNYNSLRLDFACRSPWRFEMKPRSTAERLLKKWEPAEEGTELDESLSFLADDPSFNEWLGQPEVREKVLSLTVGHHVASIKSGSDGGPTVLQFRYAPLYLVWKGRVLENVRAALEEMEALTISLERFSRSETRPVSLSSHQDDPDASGGRNLPAAKGGLRPAVPVLIVTGIALLSGVPASLLSAAMGQPNQLAASLLVILPWLGLGMLIAGVVLHRRSGRSV